MSSDSRRAHAGFGQALLASLAMVAWCAGIATAQTDVPASPAHVGIIKLRRVYENMQETIDSQQAVTDMRKQLDAMTQTHRAQLKGLQDKIVDAKTRGAADRESVVDELDRDTFDFQLEEQGMQAKILRAQNRQMLKGFEEIKAAVSDIASRRGLDLVMVDNGQDAPPNIADQTNMQNVGNLLFNRDVLSAMGQVDITADAIAVLNRGYKSFAAAAPTLPITPMQIGSRTFQIEIAADDAGRTHGLMERDAIAPDHGMIFVFPAAEEQNFWMHHTRFSLDIIYADEHGRVVSVKNMKAYDETPVPSDGAAKYAIELPAGQAAATGVKAGDQVKIPAVVDAALKK